MKEIKFKAILNEEARSEYSTYKGPLYFTLEQLMRGKVFFMEPNHWTILRWTGFYDKNNREIYEGDIIGSSRTGNMVGAVELSNAGYHCNNLMVWAIACPEIIGNIYENKDLLK